MRDVPKVYKKIMCQGVIHKRRPQGGGRGVKGKGTRADIGGGGSSKGGRPQKNFEES